MYECPSDGYVTYGTYSKLHSAVGIHIFSNDGINAVHSLIRTSIEGFPVSNSMFCKKGMKIKVYNFHDAYANFSALVE